MAQAIPLHPAFSAISVTSWFDSSRAPNLWGMTLRAVFSRGLRRRGGLETGPEFRIACRANRREFAGVNAESTPQTSTLPVFLAGLAGLGPNEVRNAKILWIRNAIADFRAEEIKAKAQWWGFSLMWLIPWGWPVIYANRREVTADLEARRQCIENAMHVWREDLAGEQFDW
jgi:hypothetical protein